MRNGYALIANRNVLGFDKINAGGYLFRDRTVGIRESWIGLLKEKDGDVERQ